MLGRDHPDRPPADADTIRIVDDEGATLLLASPPERVVSLVPAFTELLFAIGAGDRLVGRTRFGVHPAAAREIPSVGDGVRPSIERVAQAEPDLVVLFAGPDNRGVAEQLTRLGIPALSLAHNSLGDLDRNVLRLGLATGCWASAEELRQAIRNGLDRLSAATADFPRPDVYYDVWADPPITVGAGSYLDSLISVAGGRNVFGEIPEASPRVSLESIAIREPELILSPWSALEDPLRLSPRDRPGWGVVAAARRGAVRRIDGDLMHRLGPRIVDAAFELARAIHPEALEVRAASPATIPAIGTCAGR